ncbi:DUF742 domain-containing protein [Actinomycetospora sp. TBRC 11914]|uniref:DUF742 domain-containing protein n=1 Tax=Actinomycetospora sp. TBRC 11914 TaxID=2729387 RepID=UPI0028982A68|nr:DUF742 domain-containing protein [Actinomycetospora sp. TBRC 11914]
MSQGPPEDNDFADVLNGITGGAPRRPSERRGLFGRRRKSADGDAASPADHDAARALDGQPGPDAGGAHRSPPHGVPVGPRSGGWRPDVAYPDPAHPDPAYPEPAGPPHHEPAAPTTPGGLPLGNRHEVGAPDYPDGPRSGDEPPESSFVRPYAWTRGRTRPAYDLAVETLLSTTARGRDPEQVTQYEHRMIADLCRDPKSVAEVGALLSLPLGVARVLLGDMAAHGSIVVHETASSTGDAPDMALMERVLSGLRRL